MIFFIEYSKENLAKEMEIEQKYDIEDYEKWCQEDEEEGKFDLVEIYERRHNAEYVAFLIREVIEYRVIQCSECTNCINDDYDCDCDDCNTNPYFNEEKIPSLCGYLIKSVTCDPNLGPIIAAIFQNCDFAETFERIWDYYKVKDLELVKVLVSIEDGYFDGDYWEDLIMCAENCCELLDYFLENEFALLFRLHQLGSKQKCSVCFEKIYKSGEFYCSNTHLLKEDIEECGFEGTFNKLLASPVRYDLTVSID